MIKIAIVDDSLEDIRHTETIVKGITKENHDVQIYTCQNSDFFVHEIKEGQRWNVYIVDVEMPKRTGLDVLRTIRDNGDEGFVIFLTNHREYAVDGYELAVFRYIMKDCMEEKLPEALDHILPEIRRRRARYYVLEKTSGEAMIDYADIIRIEKVGGKNSVLYTRTGEHVVRSSLKKILEQLNSSDFIIPNKGIAVNLGHVNGIKDQTMTLTKNAKVEIAKSKIGYVKQEVARYSREKR